MGITFAIVLWCGFGAPQQLLAHDTPVSLSIDVGRADNAVAKLSKVSGLNLSTSEPLSSETVYIRAKKRPTFDVMTRLAQVTGGTWKKKGNGFVLARNPQVGSAESEKKRRLARLTKYRDELLRNAAIPMTQAKIAPLLIRKQELEKLGEKDHSYELDDKITDLIHLAPIYRCIGKCLSTISLKDMASLRPQTQITYSDEPYPNQRKLSDKVVDAVGTLIDEQKEWKSIYKRTLQSDPDTVNGHVPNSKQLKHFSLTVRSSQDNLFGVRLVTKEPNGYENEIIDEDFIWTLHRDSDPVFEKVPKLISPRPSAATAAFWRRIKGNVDSTDFERFLLDPVNNDPLWLGNHELLDSLSLQQSKSVIACLPDKSVFYQSDEFSLDKYLMDSLDRGLQRSQTSDWICFQPKDMWDHRAHRADRRDIAAYTNEIRQRGKLDIRRFAKVMESESQLSYGFVEVIDPNYRWRWGSFRFPFQKAFIALLNSLTVDQYRDLSSGKIIPYQTLLPAQRTLCSEIVFSPRMNVDTQGLADAEQLKGVLTTGRGLAMEIKTEDRVCFHNGKKDSGDDVFHVADINGPPYALMGEPPRYPDGGMKNARYDVRHMSSITLKCFLKDDEAVLGQFVQPMPPSSTQPVRLDQLPSSIQAKLAEHVKGLETMYGYLNKKG